MRMFVIRQNIIENIIEADEGFSLSDADVVSAEGIDADIGWTWDDGSPKAPELPPAPFRDLSRPAFLFMMGKLGITKQHVYDLIDAMPDGTSEEADAKALARIVFDEQQTFKRDNALLAALSGAAGLTSEQVDDAWRIGEGLSW